MKLIHKSRRVLVLAILTAAGMLSACASQPQQDPIFGVVVGPGQQPQNQQSAPQQGRVIRGQQQPEQAPQGQQSAPQQGRVIQGQ